ncbi:hypothetical protein Aph01nite_32030 [Acrocarpospora phusangensis]|uniref:Uncharacterized protein n=1 Tax=Acrocarpospora phusangensis TaxID=1070424 RepID=A0A919QA73_9ACTN|nr:hypothetical protein [Acrocarpospora phusangensis]GIH24893.1 hypothetical protein Aph01nite_32030 [Acrocarpospora phusangensis]
MESTRAFELRVDALQMLDGDEAHLGLAKCISTCSSTCTVTCTITTP